LSQIIGVAAVGTGLRNFHIIVIVSIAISRIALRVDRDESLIAGVAGLVKSEIV
jgi:hypothetical protein